MNLKQDLSDSNCINNIFGSGASRLYGEISIDNKYLLSDIGSQAKSIRFIFHFSRNAH
jgi:hypothetical protein